MKLKYPLVAAFLLVPLLVAGAPVHASAATGPAVMTTRAAPEQTLDERVRAIIAEELDVPPATVTDTARLVEDLQASPVELTSMWVALEQALDITISDERTDAVHTVRDVIEAVRNPDARAAAAAVPAGASAAAADDPDLGGVLTSQTEALCFTQPTRC